MHGPRSLQVPGSIALRETFRNITRFGGGLVLWLSSGTGLYQDEKGSGSSCNQEASGRKLEKLVRSISSSMADNEYLNPRSLDKVRGSMLKQLTKEAEKLRFLPFLSMGGVLVPAFGTMSWKMLESPLGSAALKEFVPVDQLPCDSENQGCSCLTVPDLPRKRYAVEPRTGIEFPVMLETVPAGERCSSLTSKILVGTGSRSMKIIKIKSLKVYAFGFYIHPNSVCEKLGPRYASIPTGELNKCRNFYEDLLREDIHMTVRLVISCNGLKINAVKDAFQKCLWNRLEKTNPNTDYRCLSKFGSIFQRDIPLPVGTTIDFHQTSDGNLITEIGGNRIGAVKSKELCRAFFDMYIGDLPVSEQAKEEIGQNVAGILGRC
ncbi:hypothetical protein MLD38_006503 [Melastoma candidum]|uniref:Uncharacterized protein n=1 Tax=Melastoma candidum TaxID=119954 RepID=A0ACB9RPA6_9MYRT|nr:hypothetical protein MLD38_006503 [Melastoma candidum]